MQIEPATAKDIGVRQGLGLGLAAGRHPSWLPTIIRYYIQPAARRGGIQKNVGWQKFRQTLSTLIKSLGVDAKVVQELLRHASFKTTMDGCSLASNSRNAKRKNNLRI